MALFVDRGTLGRRHGRHIAKTGNFETLVAERQT